MNPLQIEQMMMSSFPLSSILHATGALLLEYPYTLRLSRLKQVTSTGKKQTDVPLLHVDRCAPGKLWQFRFRWKMAVRELGLFCDCIFVFP